MGDAPPGRRAVVEAVLGPLTDLPLEQARHQADRLLELLASMDQDAVRQGLELLELCGDWPTLSFVSEVMQVTPNGEVHPDPSKAPQLQAEDPDEFGFGAAMNYLPEPEVAAITWTLAALGGKLAEPQRLRVPPDVARLLGPRLLQLAPAATELELSLSADASLEVVPLPEGLLLVSREALSRVTARTLEVEALFYGNYLRDALRVHVGSTHLVVGNGRAHLLSADGTPVALGRKHRVGKDVQQAFPLGADAALLVTKRWLHELSLPSAVSSARHAWGEAQVLATLPSGELLGLRHDTLLWRARPGAAQTSFTLPFRPSESVQQRGRWVLLQPGGWSPQPGPFAVVDLQTGAHRAHDLPAPLLPRALLDDGSVLASTGRSDMGIARLQLWPGPGAGAPRPLPPTHASALRDWLPLPGGRLLTVSEDTAALWDGRTATRLARVRPGAYAVTLKPGGQVAFKGAEGPGAWNAADLSPAGPPSPSQETWDIQGVRFVREEGRLFARLGREAFEAWLLESGRGAPAR